MIIWTFPAAALLAFFLYRYERRPANNTLPYEVTTPLLQGALLWVLCGLLFHVPWAWIGEHVAAAALVAAVGTACLPAHRRVFVAQ